MVQPQPTQTTMKIPLTQGQVAIVDYDSYEVVNKYKWHASWDIRTKAFYATKSTGIKSMHRMITNAPKGLCVDHIDGNTLNNTSANLRLVTNRQNFQNLHKAKSSLYPGVSWHKKTKKWYARINITGKNNGSINLGFYTDEREAFKAYLSACEKYGFPTELMVEKFGNME